MRLCNHGNRRHNPSLYREATTAIPRRLNLANCSSELSVPLPATHLSRGIHGIDPAVDDRRLGDRYAAFLCPEGRDGPPHL